MVYAGIPDPFRAVQTVQPVVHQPVVCAGIASGITPLVHLTYVYENRTRPLNGDDRGEPFQVMTYCIVRLFGFDKECNS